MIAGRSAAARSMRFAPGRGFDHAGTVGPERISHDAPNLRLVVNHEYDVFLHGTKSGRLTSNGPASGQPNPFAILLSSIMHDRIVLF